MTKYSAGADFERRVGAGFALDGYFVVRSAGSRGVCDLVAIKLGQVLLVQVKRTNPVLPPTARFDLVLAAERIGAVPLVAFQPAPRKPVEFRRLTGYEAGQWEPFYLDEIEASA